MSALESHLHKIMGQQVEPFEFFQSCSSVEYMRIPKVEVFKVAFIE